MEEIKPIIEDPFISSSSSSSSCTKEEDEKVDNLLEKAWFFGNSLNHKIANEKNLHNRHHSSLARVPSLPAYNVIKKISTSDHQEKETNNKLMITRQKSLSSYTQPEAEQVIGNSTERVNRGSSKKKKNDINGMRRLSAKTKNVKRIGGGLSRSDSVPIPTACLIIKEEEEEEEEENPDEESYARLSNLIRQALPDTSDSKVAAPAPSPSPRHTSKGIIQSSSFPITRLSSQNSESTTINSKPSQQKTNYLQPLNKTGLRRTMTSLEFDEVEGFKDMTFTRQKSLSSYTQQETGQVIGNSTEKVNSGSSKKKKKNDVNGMRRLSAAMKNVKPIGGGLSRSDSVPIPTACLIIKEEEEEEENPDEESYARLSNLIRQALPDTSDSKVAAPAPSPRHTSKGIIQSSSFPITRLSSQNSESTTINSKPSQQKTNYLQPLNKTGLRRTMTSLEFDEVEGFKDTTFTFKNKSPTTPPPTSSKKVLNSSDFLSLDQEDKKPPMVRKLGRTQSLSPPIPSSIVKQPTAEDMKEQIKFWARSVACNINPQE